MLSEDAKKKRDELTAALKGLSREEAMEMTSKLLRPSKIDFYIKTYLKLPQKRVR